MWQASCHSTDNPLADIQLEDRLTASHEPSPRNHPLANKHDHLYTPSHTSSGQSLRMPGVCHLAPCCCRSCSCATQPGVSFLRVVPRIQPGVRRRVCIDLTDLAATHTRRTYLAIKQPPLRFSGLPFSGPYGQSVRLDGPCFVPCCAQWHIPISIFADIIRMAKHGERCTATSSA